MTRRSKTFYRRIFTHFFFIDCSVPTVVLLLTSVVFCILAKIQDINKDLDYDLSEQDAGFVIVGKLETAVTVRYYRLLRNNATSRFSSN